MTPAQTSAPAQPEQPAQRFALVVHKPGTGFWATWSHYTSEEEAKKDMAYWATHPWYKDYTQQAVMPADQADAYIRARP